MFDRVSSRSEDSGLADLETFYNLDTLRNVVQHIKVARGWAISLTACWSWCVCIPVRMPCSHTAVQEAYAESFPDTAGALFSSTSNSTLQLFRRAFFLWRLLELHDGREDVDSALSIRVAGRHEKGRPTSGLEDTLEEYIDYMRSQLTVRSVHECRNHSVFNRSQDTQVRACVMDGKVMPVQVCRVRYCTEPVVSRTVAFCDIHRHLSSQCRVVGCSRMVKSSIVECCDDEEHIGMWNKYIISRDKKASMRYQARNRGIPKTVLVNDGRRKEDEDDSKLASGKPVALFGPAYLPDVLVLVWSCGVVASVWPIFSQERMQDVGEFLQRALQDIPQSSRPHVTFYDNACNLGPHLQKGNRFPLAKEQVLVVDRFHICGHSESDSKCREKYAPNAVPLVNDIGGKTLLILHRRDY